MKRIFAALLILAAYIAIQGLLGNQISRDLETKNELSQLELRIQTYAARHDRLPKSLNDLPARPGYDDRVVDGWGKNILYHPDADGSVTLSSLGGTDRNDARSIRFSIIPEEGPSGRYPKMLTFDYMWVIEQQCRKYVDVHHQLPGKLSDLPPENNRVIFDGWGSPIKYDIGPNGLVVLTNSGQLGSKQIFSTAFIVAGVKPELTTKD